MIQIICFLILFIFPLPQDIDKRLIIQSGDYYYGSGTSHDVKEAKDNALAELTSQIAVHVQDSFKRVVREGAEDFTDNVQSILKTHSAATLRNVKTIKTPSPDGRIRVFCYLKKTEVEKIFAERRKLIADMVGKAKLYQRERNISHALKLYYFAAILLNSLPDETVVYQGVNYTTEIPQRINNIILNTDFLFLKSRKISDQEREITVQVTYQHKPVAMLDFTFWDGVNQVAVQARDGLATFRLLGGSMGFRRLKLNIQYAYYECRREYNIITTLWSLVNKPSFNSQKIVELKPEADQPQPDVSMKSGYNIKLNYQEDVPVASTILQETDQFLHMLQQGAIHKIDNAYGEDHFLCDKLKRYIRHNHPKPIDEEVRATIKSTSLGWELRRIRVLHRYPSIHQQSTEYLTLDFSEEGKLIDLNVSITDVLYQRFVKALRTEMTGAIARRSLNSWKNTAPHI